MIQQVSIMITKRESQLYDQLVLIEYEIKRAKNLSVGLKNKIHSENLDICDLNITNSKEIILEGVQVKYQKSINDLINECIDKILKKEINQKTISYILKLKDFNSKCPVRKERQILAEVSRLSKFKPERIDNIFKESLYIKRFNSFFK